MKKVFYEFALLELAASTILVSHVRVYRLLCLNILYADTYSAVIGKIHLCTHPPRVQTFNWQYNKPLVDVAGLYLGHHVNCIHNCEYNPGL